MWNGSASAAVAVLYRGAGGTPVRVSLTAGLLGLAGPRKYRVSEVFRGRPLGVFKSGQKVEVRVNPSGVAFLRFDALPLLDRGDDHETTEEEGEELAEIKVEDFGMSGWRREDGDEDGRDEEVEENLDEDVVLEII